MNKLEKNMVETLIDLKNNHHVVGIKAEFEAEGTRIEEAMRLKEVVTRAGLDLTIKIGGCEAIKDMYESRVIGVAKIIAPMVETAYALKKYIGATKLVFPNDEDEVKFLVNIETITGFNNLDEMLAIPESKKLFGIVLGRVDMTGSMGLSRDDINSDEILKIAQVIATKAKQHNLKLVIGGGVSAASIPFFKQLPEDSLYCFETRKVIFDARKAVYDPKNEAGILKAVGFELMWLKNKREFYGMIHAEDEQRLVMLETRYKKLIEEAGVKGV